MNDPNETAIHLDLSKRDWFVFDDCFGTSEEKLLIKFIDKHYDDLKKCKADTLCQPGRSFQPATKDFA